MKRAQTVQRESTRIRDRIGKIFRLTYNTTEEWGHSGSEGIELRGVCDSMVLLCWLCILSSSSFFLKYSSDRKP